MLEHHAAPRRFMTAVVLLCAMHLTACTIDNCIKNGSFEYASEISESYTQQVAYPNLPFNTDNIFHLYMHGGGSGTTLTTDSQGAHGIAFRARVMDGQDEGAVQFPSNLFAGYVLGYGFPTPECTVDLHWEVDPSVYLPQGLEVFSSQSNSQPFVDFELSIVEDPPGQFSAGTIPDAVWQDNIVDNVRFNESFSDGRSVFRGKHTGVMRVVAGGTPKLFVRLGIWLRAPMAADTACIGCNLTDPNRNDLLNSAFFKVGGPGRTGPFWYTERAN